MAREDLTESIAKILQADVTFDAIVQQFVNAGPKKSCFRRFCILGDLLEGLLEGTSHPLTIHQRIAGYFLLNDFPNSTADHIKHAINPFIPLFFDPIEKRNERELARGLSASARNEAAAVRQWVSTLLFLDPTDKKLRQRRVRDVVSELARDAPLILESEAPNIEEIKKAYDETSPSKALRRDGESGSLLPASALTPERKGGTLSVPIDPAEFMWPLTAEEIPPFSWDYAAGKPESQSRAELRELMTRAIIAPLTPTQSQSLLMLMAADPLGLWVSGLHPSKISELVEHNPMIAAEALTILHFNMPGPHFIEYLLGLLQMDMSLHSMEVVNRLTMHVTNLPTEFLQLYVANCMASCEAVKDKYIQNRLVRLVCVFLQCLIRQNFPAVADMLIEIQAFCVQFSRIREAAALFRMVRALEGGGEDTS